MHEYGEEHKKWQCAKNSSVTFTTEDADAFHCVEPVDYNSGCLFVFQQLRPTDTDYSWALGIVRELHRKTKRWKAQWIMAPFGEWTDWCHGPHSLVACSLFCFLLLLYFCRYRQIDRLIDWLKYCWTTLVPLLQSALPWSANDAQVCRLAEGQRGPRSVTLH